MRAVASRVRELCAPVRNVSDGDREAPAGQVVLGVDTTERWLHTVVRISGS